MTARADHPRGTPRKDKGVSRLAVRDEDGNPGAVFPPFRVAHTFAKAKRRPHRTEVLLAWLRGWIKRLGG